jgi:hypothetical protein
MGDFEKESEERAIALRSKVDSLNVTDQGSYDLAQEFNKAAYDGKKKFHEWFDPIDEASKKQRQATIAQGKKIDEPFDYVIKTTGNKCATWYRAEQARIDEEKRKAEEAARKEAEDAQIRAAESLFDEGMEAASDAVLEAPVVIPKIEIAGPDKSEGISYRDQWGAECVDLMALVKAVASGTAPLYFLQANATALNTWARNSKGTEKVPGVRVTNTPIQVRR